MSSDNLKASLKSLLIEILSSDVNIEPPRFSNHRDAVTPWLRSLESGTFDGRPFSHYTIGFYTRYVEDYLSRFSSVSFSALEQALSEMPVEQFSKKNKYYQAIVCFSKYLIRENSLGKDFLDKVKHLKPKRHIPAKQTCVNATQLQALFKACRTQYETLIITVLSETGLRAHEFCALKMRDLDLQSGVLTVNQGKWGKRRKIGLNSTLVSLLKDHCKRFHITEAGEHVFVNSHLEPLSRESLLHRLYKVGKRAGVHVHPHALRRTFVTLNANEGRPLQMLQMACGHANITTTLSYCKTTEEDLLKAMKTWHFTSV